MGGPSSESVEKGLSTLVVVVPVLHIIMSATYLAGYGNGFGNVVVEFFAAADVFKTSIRDLFGLYVNCLIIPLGILAWRFTWKNGPYLEDRILAIEDPNTRQVEKQNLDKTRRVLYIVLLIPFIFGLMFLIIPAYYNLPPRTFFAMNSISLSLTPLWWKFCNNIRFYGWRSDATILALTFVILVFCSGFDDGAHHRMMPDRHFVNSDVGCEKVRILRSVGDNFVGITQLGTRVIIDSDCKTKFTFRTLPAYRNISMSSAIRGD